MPRLRTLHVLLDTCGMSADERVQRMATPGLLNSLLYSDGGQGTHEEWTTGARGQVWQWAEKA